MMEDEARTNQNSGRRRTASSSRDHGLNSSSALQDHEHGSTAGKHDAQKAPSHQTLEHTGVQAKVFTTSPITGTTPPLSTAAPSVAPLPVTVPAALPFVAPSDLLRPQASRAQSSWGTAAGTGADAVARDSVDRPMTPLDREQINGLRAIRAFLKVRTSYDVLPLSYRLIVFDTSLLVKKSLNILTQCAIVSAPLWDSKTSTFAGLLTTSDYINVVQYYWQNPDSLQQIDQFRLNGLREIERAIGVTPIETVSIHPLQPLYDACRRMLESRARRIPLIDTDDETQREMVVSVITQYRILKFISVNVKETQNLRKPLRDIKVGTYTNLATATMDTPVMDCIHMLVKKSISSVPILDPKDGTVLNVFESVDVISLIKGGDYENNLNLTVGKALDKRSDDFPGIYTCTLNDRLDTIFDTIRKSRVHRLVIIDEQNQLKGLLSLSDILDYTLNSPLGDGND
ncbi:5'-AMP-activated protein kinase subunit gamma [Fulvia fulva]|uniref:5'-AMP-activated protein kinase subunit gamma n=1 Tax=Passalora fulva TaxID=5499 RepID=A0A9Q8LBI4_PASFU|nr:5'-AMP-activated protein kinase subunit gamma [Fulvia fulva]KAK4631018.1 5'-AMP-activated protein kinase subunit gamma [Fulvia fulva]KAK4632448.1 5'-AMP-activated protein kinase subunit gamma [Fulvia fulva]UJO14336.1 5'-AMP-activated protein kinase subunit gamma [Fulvia fulva]WPV11642.1 5'-AMP-activated protein kinase subunit gamma [Fulvia fulva]WPV26519.1 5'-AMP-activated protein kinase subunit gamma [Fulvia fulva]